MCHRIGAAVIVGDGEDAAWPERDRSDALGRRVGERGGDFAGGGVPQIGAAVRIAGGASWPPAPFWEGVTAVAALAAIGIPEIGPGVQFVVGRAARRRRGGGGLVRSAAAPQGRSSDISGLITTVLAVSSIMTCVLGLAAGGSR